MDPNTFLTIIGLCVSGASFVLAVIALFISNHIWKKQVLESLYQDCADVMGTIRTGAYLILDGILRKELDDAYSPSSVDRKVTFFLLKIQGITKVFGLKTLMDQTIVGNEGTFGHKLATLSEDYKNLLQIPNEPTRDQCKSIMGACDELTNLYLDLIKLSLSLKDRILRRFQKANLEEKTRNLEKNESKPTAASAESNSDSNQNSASN